MILHIFSAEATSSSEIRLSWLDNSHIENGFRVERKVGQTGEYAQIANLGANAFSYSDTD